MGGTTAAAVRRMSDANFTNRYFVGEGLDIGGGLDSLSHYAGFFSRMGRVTIWDIKDGDAQFMKTVADNRYDFIYSSHCLEHLADPKEGLVNWLRIVKPGGHLIVTMPDEDLYEQGVFPSTFNPDHKWTFTIFKSKSWSPRSINLISLLAQLGNECEIEKIELLNSTYRYNLPRFDQSHTAFAECGIEFIIRKRPRAEIDEGGRLPEQNPTKEQLIESMALLEARLSDE